MSLSLAMSRRLLFILHAFIPTGIGSLYHKGPVFLESQLGKLLFLPLFFLPVCKNFILVFFMCVGICLHVCLNITCMHNPQKPQEDIRSPRTDVTDLEPVRECCELSLGLKQSRKCFEPWSLLCSLLFCY